jgi:hypothetical protein
MELKHSSHIEISDGLLDAIRSFPLDRVVEHCGARISIAPFDYYAECPRCRSRIKVRSFSAAAEVEDVFDAVFEWMNRPTAQEVTRRRQEALEDEE